MKTKVAVAEWNNATDALKDATTLAIHGQHKGAESRAYFAIEHGLEPRSQPGTRNRRRTRRSGERSSTSSSTAEK